MKLVNRMRTAGATTLLALAAVLPSLAWAQANPAPEGKKPHAFNVLNQRTLALTAEYWNPIVTYVAKKSGVPLQLRLAKNAKEGNESAEKGAYDFLYTNHFFTPEREAVGFHVIARQIGPGLQSQIVVPSDSPIRTLQELEGKDVGFVSPDAFAGYHVPHDAILRAKINVKISFTGNQEASVAQLKVGKIVAAGVNGLVLERYARREGFAYRALWTSPIYPDLSVMAHKRVPAEDVAAVKAALVGMDKDPEGKKILEASSALIKALGAVGFVAAEDKDYDSYRTFYRTTAVKR